ncbi:TonB-dependent receptor [Pseudoduganella lutea]|uniref:TonB-dependent receptor n=1 Tax=Pseudoduganella lutea TaxID=321985 RepID=A0A4P6KRU4_9BURK|nr:TonB-dependent receptor [Pseudoduganella lutea]QBE61821.1 TonB-dependent receptor [Pseudoduganella lutea]
MHQNHNTRAAVATKPLALQPLAAVVALALAQWALPAHGQASPEAQPDPNRLQSVVVTANKRVEKLESVPMAISVLSEEELQRNNVREIEDVVALTPSLTQASGTTAANNALFMRGIGTVSVGIGVESDVSVIIDDIPIAVQFQAFRDLADVARVEVLKGPQSTLFGKSAVAGAINIVTKPISGPIVYRGSAYYTDDHEWRLAASVGGRMTDTFGMRIAVNKSDMPGNFTNLTTGEKVNGSSGKTLMAKFTWTPVPNLDIDFMPQYNEQSNTRGVTAVNGFYRTTGSAAAGNLARVPVDLSTAYMNGNPQLPASLVLAGIDPTNPNNRSVRRDFPTGISSRTTGTGLKLSYTLPNDAILMSISSYQRYKANDARDQDFTDVPTIARPGETRFTVGNSQFGSYDIRSKTQEFRLVSPDAGSLRYVAGLWWARNEIDRHFIRGFCVAPARCAANSPSSPTNYYTDIYNVNKAVFGQGTWDFAPTWTLVAGVRRNLEESGFNYERSFYTDQLDRATFVPGPVGVDVFSSSGNEDWATTGKLSIQKQVTGDVMVYAMTATGHKGKAYDVTSGLRASAAFPVDPETSRTYELGTKANLFNNRLSVAATLFKTDFKHYQQNTSFVLPDDPTIYTQLNSIPKIRTKGFEIDANMLLSPGWSVNAALAYTRPSIVDWKNGPCYQDNTNPAIGNTGLGEGGSLGGWNRQCFPIRAGATTGIQDLSGGVFPGTPKVKVNIGSNYEMRLTAIPYRLFVNGNVRYQSDYQTSINNDPRAVNDSYTIADLGFGIREDKDRWRLSFRVNNLFDRFYIPNANASGLSFRAGPTSTSPSITVDNWVPPRDVFRYFSAKLDVKF